MEPAPLKDTTECHAYSLHALTGFTGNPYGYFIVKHVFPFFLLLIV